MSNDDVIYAKIFAFQFRQHCYCHLCTSLNNPLRAPVPMHRTRINDCHFLHDALILKATLFQTPNGWHVVQIDWDREKLSKFKLKLIDRAKFGQRWSVQKSPLKFEQFLYRRTCVPCAKAATCAAIHRTRWDAHSNGEYSKHDSLGDGKADRIERVKWWDGFPPASLRCNLCASPTPRTSIMFSTFWAAHARALVQNYF